jgi:hypothetical protein
MRNRDDKIVGDARETGSNSSSGPRLSRMLWVLIGAVMLLIFIVVAVLVTPHNKNAKLPQADQEHSTIFQGMSSFIDSGLTTDQDNGLIKAFSKFSPKSRDISVDVSSLSPGPHNPDSSDPSFTINFSVRIDSASYAGTARYSGLHAVRLILYTKDDKQVFDSGIIDQSATNPDYSSGATE